MPQVLQILIVSFSFLLFFSFPSYSQDKEVDLYNAKGNPIAYISIEDSTIYLWNGKPVAYLLKVGDNTSVYGFNGYHLGWFEEGVVYDISGDATGVVESKVKTYIAYKPCRGYKHYKPYKVYRRFAFEKKNISGFYSNTPLALFFLNGVFTKSLLN